MGLTSLFKNIWRNIIDLSGEEIKGQLISDEQCLKIAQEEMEEAQNLFSFVTDPEMIDYAIYRLKAAETKYDYILKIIRKRT